MKKRELDKLRTLNATKAMIDAANEPGTEKDWLGKIHKLKYRYVLREQQLGGIIKVAMFKSEDIVKGYLSPAYEIFLNYEGETFISREKQKDGTWKWRTAMILNLENGYHEYKYDRTCWINKDAELWLRKMLKVNKGDADGIQQWQEVCRKKEMDKKVAKTVRAWDLAMKPIGKLPKGFENWWKHEGFNGDNHIFYEDSRHKDKGFCTSCLKIVPISTNPKHNDKGRCEACGKKIDYISRKKKINSIWSYERIATCVQKYEDGLVVRYFWIRRIDEKSSEFINRPEFYCEERKRVIICSNAIQTYIWEDYKNRGYRWTLDRYNSNVKENENMYPKNLRSVLSGMNTSYPIARKAGYRAAGIVYFLKREKEDPIIERVFKAGLVNLGMDFIKWNTSPLYYDTDQRELAKQLKIDNGRMQRLKEMDGDVFVLSWLQREKQQNTIYKDDVIKLFSVGKIRGNYKSLNKLEKYMSLQKICNYVTKQIRLRDPEGEFGMQQISGTISDWADYVEMLEKSKMDCTKEILLKPKDLKIAHNEMVAMMTMKQSKKDIEKIEEKFPGAKKLCESKELQKYEYKGEKYCIITPTSIEDIFQEGIILKHCIHTCDIYFNRIENRETFLVFLRRTNEPDKPWYTLEIEPGGNIRQKKSVLNEAYKDLDDAMPFIKEWQQWIVSNMTDEDKKLAKESDEARKSGYKQLRKDKKVIWHGRLKGTLLADALEQDFMAVV